MEEGGELQILKDSIAASAIYLEPMEMFEPNPEPAPSLLRTILERTEPKADADRTDFFYWLRRSQQSEPKPASYAAFYGSSVNGGKIPPTDIDLLLLSGTPATQLAFRHPEAFHIYQIDRRQESYHLFLARGLLFFAEPSQLLIGTIEEARSKIRGSFETGIFQMMLYAAYKSLTTGEAAFDKEGWESIDGPERLKKPNIKSRSDDLGSMYIRFYSLFELNGQMRCQLRDMDARELKVVTDAAIRRMRIRAAFKEGLADRFCHEVRKKLVCHR